MKLICNILLVFYLVFRPLIPMVEYGVNYKYIKEVLCVNKERPELHCNGKCYLKKELAKINEVDSSFPIHKIKTTGQKVLDSYIPSEIVGVENEDKMLFLTIHDVYNVYYSYIFLKYIFKPPVLN
ncbi:hypothetical protein D1631_01700 [Chryseobacterium nematophagum]|uniref:Uncharacterized protein n=1 Tax=Chryseobacterium nematophagum TaxID=2305228 RepID=A0A3M7TCP5_9FLAO|nr:hypothetical protein [Chryseobacterium nematophagum]RNA60736.1 hypothetical protein D1631_01700 [Chryseobacterium nematophagum]